MNYLLDKLPQAVLIDGKAVPIHTDFRVCLRVVQAMEDERLMEHEKLTVLLTLLYPEPPEILESGRGYECQQDTPGSCLQPEQGFKLYLYGV